SEKDVIHGPTNPAVRFPPREPNRSISRTDAPLRAAATAAASPAGPLPTTKTSVGSATGIVRVYVRVSTLILLLLVPAPYPWTRPLASADSAQLPGPDPHRRHAHSQRSPRFLLPRHTGTRGSCADRRPLRRPGTSRSTAAGRLVRHGRRSSWPRSRRCRTGGCCCSGTAAGRWPPVPAPRRAAPPTPSSAHRDRKSTR